MIPMSCPSCGRRGNVPLDRLNTRMHCKKCDAVFHLDPTGKPVLGEPPAAKGTKGAKGARDKNEPLDPIGIVAAKLVKVPKPIYYTLATILGGYLLYVILPLFFASGPRPEGADFAELNEKAANAFLDNDLETIQKLSTKDTREDSAEFVRTFRSLVGDTQGKGREGIGQVLVVAPEQIDENPKFEISIQPNGPPEGPAPPMFLMDLVWFKSNGKLYLNGQATLEANNTRQKVKEEAEAFKKKGKSGKSR